MDKLYATFRDRYVHQAIKGDAQGSCVFCDIFNTDESDEQRFVLFKDASVAVILNIYPYNGGHLLIIPKEHVAEFDKISDKHLGQSMVAVSKSMNIIKEVLGCEGMNFGANIGKTAGAGIPQHVHMHIVPRFSGDTGFFTTIGNAKQISVDLQNMYNKLKPAFDKAFRG